VTRDELIVTIVPLPLDVITEQNSSTAMTQYMTMFPEVLEKEKEKEKVAEHTESHLHVEMVVFTRTSLSLQRLMQMMYFVASKKKI
jgi:hypothetical protein